jgi:DnaK suppressor protein
MSRNDSLLRLHQRLVGKRDALRDKLSIQAAPKLNNVGDLGDAAHEGETLELNSQLKSLETRELRLVERAIQMIRDGQYGVCETCDNSIPIARLQALPYTVLCVECQRLEEETGTTDEIEVNWENACEYEGRFNDQEITLDDLNMDT